MNIIYASFLEYKKFKLNADGKKIKIFINFLYFKNYKSNNIKIIEVNCK